MRVSREKRRKVTRHRCATCGQAMDMHTTLAHSTQTHTNKHINNTRHAKWTAQVTRCSVVLSVPGRHDPCIHRLLIDPLSRVEHAWHDRHSWAPTRSISAPWVVGWGTDDCYRVSSRSLHMSLLGAGCPVIPLQPWTPSLVIANADRQRWSPTLVANAGRGSVDFTTPSSSCLVLLRGTSTGSSSSSSRRASAEHALLWEVVRPSLQPGGRPP